MWSIILSQSELYSDLEKWGLKEGFFLPPPEGEDQTFLKSSKEGIPNFFFASLKKTSTQRELEILDFLKKTLPKIVVSSGLRENLSSEFEPSNPIFVPVVCRRLAGPCDFGGGPLLYQDLKINSEAQATLRKIFSLETQEQNSESLLDQTKKRQTLRTLSSEYSPEGTFQKDWTYTHLFCQTWDPLLGDLLLTGDRFGFTVGSMSIIENDPVIGKKTFLETWKKILKDPEFVLKSLKEAHLLPRSSPPVSL